MCVFTRDNDRIAAEKDVFAFTLRLSGAARVSDEIEDTLFEAGCSDALLRQCDGQLFLDFDREAGSIFEAVISAIKAVESCNLGLSVVEVIPPGSREISAINAALCVRRDEAVLKRLEQ